MFPFSFPRSLSKSRLHLSLASSNSTPSSTTSGSWSSPLTPASAVFPIAGDVRTGNPLYAAGTNASKASIADFAETVQEALAIGRVLTPDDDPFAKGDISLNSEETPRILGAPVEWNKDFTFSPGGFHPKFEGVSPCDPCFSATNMGPLSPFASEPPCSGYPISPTSTSFPIHQNNMVRKASIELSPYENYSSRSVSPEPFASHDRSLSPSPSPVPASAFPMPPPLPTFLSGTPLHLFKPLPRIPVDVLDYSDPLYRNSNDRRKSQSYLAKRDRSSLPTSLRGQPGLPERSASTGTQSKSSSPGSAKKRPQSPFPLIRGFEGSSVTPMLTRPVDQLGGAIPSSQGVGHNISSEAEVEMWPVVVKVRQSIGFHVSIN